jgi:hypothetical protein
LTGSPPWFCAVEVQTRFAMLTTLLILSALVVLTATDTAEP